MILFHRFLDLTDELFIDVLPLVQEQLGVGEGVDREKDKESSKCIMHRPEYMSRLLLQKVFFFLFSPPPSISPALSTSAERELPGADKSPVICQTSPPCPALLFSCILLSVIESANSEKLVSIWIQSSTCETHSMADVFLVFFPPCLCCWITQFSGTHSWPRCFGIM